MYNQINHIIIQPDNHGRRESGQDRKTDRVTGEDIQREKKGRYKKRQFGRQRRENESV